MHVECLYGRSPGELFGLAKNLGDRLARGLMSKYGVLLGEGQVLKVTVEAVNVWSSMQVFYAKMGKDGRITVPRIQRELLRGRQQSLVGHVLKVTLDPT